MVDVTAELIVRFTDEGVQLIDEDRQDSVNTYPLVTYALAENTDAEVGTNIGYSNIAYTINVWAKSKSELIAAAKSTDRIMRAAEFERTGGTEQDIGGLYRYIMTYRRLVFEEYE